MAANTIVSRQEYKAARQTPNTQVAGPASVEPVMSDAAPAEGAGGAQAVLLRRQVSLARTEIHNLRNQMSSLKREHLKEIAQLKSMLQNLNSQSPINAATSSPVRSPQHDAAPPPDSIAYRTIGHIETTFQNKRAVPRQASVSAACRGCLVLDTELYSNPEHALDGLQEFSHMWIIFHFHATERNGSVPAKVSPPRLRGERRGVFATRSPHRPCSIGLSLVHILSIEGNKIYFGGVDMVSGTPVLDIKPYIPQYDCPAVLRGEESERMAAVARPPTEGTSATPARGRLALDDSIGLGPQHPIAVDTGSPISHSRSSNFSDDGLESPDNPMTPVSPSPDSPTAVALDIGCLRVRSPQVRRPPTERGAPDGQERFTPPSSAVSVAHDGVRVPQWVANPVTQPLDVHFSEDALARLTVLIGDRAGGFKGNLESLLSEDPRSQYVRNRYPDHEYSCVLEDLSITCVFDDENGVCTVIAVRNAEEMQT